MGNPPFGESIVTIFYFWGTLKQIQVYIYIYIDANLFFFQLAMSDYRRAEQYRTQEN